MPNYNDIIAGLSDGSTLALSYSEIVEAFKDRIHAHYWQAYREIAVLAQKMDYSETTLVLPDNDIAVENRATYFSQQLDYDPVFKAHKVYRHWQERVEARLQARVLARQGQFEQSVDVAKEIFIPQIRHETSTDVATFQIADGHLTAARQTIEDTVKTFLASSVDYFSHKPLGGTLAELQHLTSDPAGARATIIKSLVAFQTYYNIGA